MVSFKQYRYQVSQITDELKLEMYSLFEKYYMDVNYRSFCEDLSEKSHVLLFRTKCKSSSKLVGFSTLFKRTTLLPNQKKVTFLFSGDTVLDSSVWGSKVLQTSFFWEILRTKLLHPFSPLYWMLMSKGYKTYLMMRRNFSRSYPCRNVAIDSSVKLAMDFFYSRKFHSAYNPESLLIEFPCSKGAVKSSISRITETQLNNPEVKYFKEKNPNYDKGVELACIAEIQFTDFPKHVIKYFVKPWQMLVLRVFPSLARKKPSHV
jgi:hypothetical protein